MSEHEAGRELDALIAEKVMGWKPITDFPVGSGQPMAEGWSGFWDGHWFRWFERPDADEDEWTRWSPSTDIAAAWEVVEHCPHDDFDIRRQNGLWVATFFRPSEEYEAWADTAPLAVCLAALKAATR